MNEELKCVIRGKEYLYAPGECAVVRRERTRFLVVNHEVSVFTENDDQRPMEVIFNELNTDIHGSFKDAIRGWFDDQNICFYVSTDMMPVFDSDIEEWVEDVYDAWRKVKGYKSVDVAVWSGIEVGKIGEFWRPLFLMGKVSVYGEYISFLD